MKTSFIMRCKQSYTEMFYAKERRFFKMPTSNKTASQAGKDLRDPKTSKKDRGPIASDLAQAKKKK